MVWYVGSRGEDVTVVSQREQRGPDSRREEKRNKSRETGRDLGPVHVCFLII